MQMLINSFLYLLFMDSLSTGQQFPMMRNRAKELPMMPVGKADQFDLLLLVRSQTGIDKGAKESLLIGFKGKRIKEDHSVGRLVGAFERASSHGPMLNPMQGRREESVLFKIDRYRCTRNDWDALLKNWFLAVIAITNELLAVRLAKE